MSPRNRDVEAFFLRQWRYSMPFCPFGTKNVAKSLAVSRILLNFALRVGVDGKERAALKTRMNERIERYLAIEMWKFYTNPTTSYNLQTMFLSCRCIAVPLHCQ